MRSLALITGAKIPYWVEFIAEQVNNSGYGKADLIRLDIPESSKTRIPNIYLLNFLEKLSGFKTNFNPFKPSGIRVDFQINTLAELADFITNRKYDEILYCGNIIDFEKIIQAINKSVLIFENVSTDIRNKEITYKAFAENASVIEFNLLKASPEGKAVVNTARCKAHKFSLNANREKYSVLAWLVINYLNRKASSAKPYITLPKNASEKKGQVSAFKKFILFALEKIRAKRSNEKWILGTGISDDFENLNIDFDIIEAEAGIGIADPFIVENNNEHVIFAEYIDEKWKGSIVAVRKNTVGKYEILNILKEKYHLSYPYMLMWKNALYMVPESSQNKDVSIYKCIDFPLEWQKEKVLLEGAELVDSTIFEKDNIWWLFANGRKFTSTFNEELFIYYADSPLGPWQPHKMNPVKIDISSTRPAGNIVFKNDKILRPTQDCAVRYGHKIKWMEINVLNKNEFQETYYSETSPDWAPGLIATHNFSYWNNNIVLDGFSSK